MTASSSSQGLKPSGALTLLMVACLTIMVGCVIVPGLPGIADHLGVRGGAGWLVTLPSLGVVLLGPLAGVLIDRAGAYRGLCIGLWLYGALGAAGAGLHGAGAIVVDRFLLGGATALVMSAGTALISEFYDGRARLVMIARQGMAIELGGVVFLFLGGLLAAANWRWPFALYLVAWVLAAMVVACVPHRRDAARSESFDEADPRRGQLDVYLAASVSMIVFFTGVIMLPLRLRAMALGDAQTGYFLSFVSLAAVAAAFLMPRLVRMTSEGTTLVAAFLAYGAAHALFATVATLPPMVLGGALMGIGFGLSIPTANHMVVERSPPGRRGRNLARLSIAIFLGQFLSSFMALLPGGSAFGVAAGIALILAVVAASLRPRRGLAA